MKYAKFQRTKSVNNMLNIRAQNQQFERVNPVRFWNDKLDTLNNNAKIAILLCTAKNKKSV